MKCKKHIPIDAKICPNCFTTLNLNDAEILKQKIVAVFNEIIYSSERFEEIKESLKKINNL
jgi:hypothetical protein